jgi:four helix bundle protein
MKHDNVIQVKSFQFSLRIVKLFRQLRSIGVERELCSQLLRSGTSIGANVEEAIGGSSKRDFIHKLEIAYREARETHYWLRLLVESDLLEKQLGDSIIQDCEELVKILTSILNTSKVN